MLRVDGEVFLNLEIKSCGFKNIWICVDGAYYYLPKSKLLIKQLYYVYTLILCLSSSRFVEYSLPYVSYFIESVTKVHVFGTLIRGYHNKRMYEIL